MRVLRFALLLLATLLAAAAVAPVERASAKDPTIDDLLAQLRGDDASARSKAYMALRARDPKKVTSKLADEAHDLEVTAQYYAVLILSSFPPDETEKALRSWVKGRTPYLRVCAAQILDQRGEKGMASVIERELFRDDVPRATWQRMMVWLRYGKVPKDEDLLEALVKPLASDDVAPDPDVVLETAYVLQGAGTAAREVTTRGFGGLVGDERPGVRLVAAALLYRLGEGDGSELVAALTPGGARSTEYYFVRDCFYRAPFRAPTPAIVDAALAATHVEAPALELRALVQVIEKFDDKRAAPRLKELASHESSLVAKAAADAFARLTGAKPSIGVAGSQTDAEDTLQIAKWVKKRDRDSLAAWLTDDKVDRRLAAADALRRMDDRQGLVAVLEALVGDAVIARRDAARILGGFRAAEAVVPLIDATLDDDTTVRSYARGSLQTTLQTLFPQRRFHMLNRGGRSDDDPNVRAERAKQLRAWWKANQAADW